MTDILLKIIIVILCLPVIITLFLLCLFAGLKYLIFMTGICDKLCKKIWGRNDDV